MKTLTPNDSYHMPIKGTVELAGKQEPEIWNIRRRQRRNAHHTTQAKTMYQKEIPGLVEQTKQCVRLRKVLKGCKKE